MVMEDMFPMSLASNLNMCVVPLLNLKCAFFLLFADPPFLASWCLGSFPLVPFILM